MEYFSSPAVRPLSENLIGHDLTEGFADEHNAVVNAFIARLKEHLHQETRHTAQLQTGSAIARRRIAILED